MFLLTLDSLKFDALQPTSVLLWDKNYKNVYQQYRTHISLCMIYFWSAWLYTKNTIRSILLLQQLLKI